MKIVVDSGILITLGILHNYAGGDLKKLEDKQEVTKLLEQENVNLIDQDIENLVNLYADVVSKKMGLLVPPFVFKEIEIDSTNPSAKLTSDFFYKTNCYLFMQNEGVDEKNSEKARLISQIKTVIYSNKLENVDYASDYKPDEHYGLAPEYHSYADGSVVDVNKEDRWILAQIKVLSELDENELLFVPASEVLKNKYNYAIDIVKYYNEVDEIVNNFDYVLKMSKELFETEKQVFATKDSKFEIMFLQENEKDFGREVVEDRERTFKVKNENSVRNTELMEKVLKKVNKKVSGVVVVSPSSKKLSSELQSNVYSSEKKLDY